MQTVTLEEAKERLADLVQDAARGDEVVIVNGDQAMAKLVAMTGAEARPQFGSAKGLIAMADDFDTPLDDFAGYKK
jgi:antitoxin (DNA-binding transcriptional repressor) of toxin-antitoxin stability system